MENTRFLSARSCRIPPGQTGALKSLLRFGHAVHAKTQSPAAIHFLHYSRIGPPASAPSRPGHNPDTLKHIIAEYGVPAPASVGSFIRPSAPPCPRLRLGHIGAHWNTLFSWKRFPPDSHVRQWRSEFHWGSFKSVGHTRTHKNTIQPNSPFPCRLSPQASVHSHPRRLAHSYRSTHLIVQGMTRL